jgi:hypothetical protein
MRKLSLVRGDGPAGEGQRRETFRVVGPVKSLPQARPGDYVVINSATPDAEATAALVPPVSIEAARAGIEEGSLERVGGNG